MKYPLEKRRTSTHHEQLHRQIALILNTRYNDLHSREPYVNTVAEADAWYYMLSEEDRKWVRELFCAEIHNNEQSDRDRAYLLDTLCRWDCTLAGTISIDLWRNLPTDKSLQLQEGIAYCKCLPHRQEIEDFLLLRFKYWEKKLFLHAHDIDWIELSAAKELLLALANVIGLNSFSTGLSIYPRCIALTHRGVFDDMRFLSFLTRTVPIATIRKYPSVSKANLGRLRQYLLTQDPQYIDYLKRQQKEWSSLGEPLNSLISNLRPYQRQRPTPKLKAEVLSQLRSLALKHDQLRVNDNCEFELVMTNTLKSQRAQIEMEVPFMAMGSQVLAKELLSPTAGELVKRLPNCHITELTALHTEESKKTEFVIRFEISKA